MTKNKFIKIFFMLISFVAVLLFTNQVNAGSIKLKSLEFQIQLNGDGSNFSSEGGHRGGFSGGKGGRRRQII